MTPLQVFCSIIIPPESKKTKESLAELCKAFEMFLAVVSNPIARGSYWWSGIGTTTPLFLAASRANHQMIKSFMGLDGINFGTVNHYIQNVIHMTLKGGKFWVPEEGQKICETLAVFFDEAIGALKHTESLKCIINRHWLHVYKYSTYKTFL